MMQKTFLTFFFTVLCCVQAAVAAPLNVKQQQMLSALEKHLNSLDTLQVEFNEKNPLQAGDGKGRLAWEKGKFDWVYTAPDPMRLLSNGSQVYYVDSRNGQATQVPSSYTKSMAFLMQPRLTFKLPGVEVEDVQQKGKLVRVSLNMDTDMLNVPSEFKVDTAKQHIIFQTNPIKLVQMTTEMGSNQSETTFTRVLMNQRINSRLHSFELPSSSQDRFGS